MIQGHSQHAARDDAVLPLRGQDVWSSERVGKRTQRETPLATQRTRGATLGIFLARLAGRIAVSGRVSGRLLLCRRRAAGSSL